MSGFLTESIEKWNDRHHKESWERRKLGLELRQKYEMYFVALCFTLAGLAVQSARPLTGLLPVCLEIGGWILLATAGCVGLWRVSQMWLVLVGVAEHLDPEAPSEEIEARHQALSSLESVVRRWARPQFALFAAGLVATMLARASSILPAL